MSDGKCPNCGKMIEVRTRIGLFGVPPNVASGVIVNCPSCESILGLLPDSESIAKTVAQRIRSES